MAKSSFTKNMTSFKYIVVKSILDFASTKTLYLNVII